MHSPWIGGLLQHGHVSDVTQARRLAEAPTRRIVGPFEALRQLREAPAKSENSATGCACEPQILVL